MSDLTGPQFVPGPESEITRCRAEQRECVEFLATGTKDRHGAIGGLNDWLMEEILIDGN